MALRYAECSLCVVTFVTSTQNVSSIKPSYVIRYTNYDALSPVLF